MGDEADMLEREAAVFELRRLAKTSPDPATQPHIESLARALESEGQASQRAEVRSAVDSLREVRPPTLEADRLIRRADAQGRTSRAALVIVGVVDAIVGSLVAWQFDAADGQGGSDLVDAWAAEFGGRYDHPSLEVVVVGNVAGLAVAVAMLALARQSRERSKRFRSAGQRWASAVERLALRSALILGLEHVPLPAAAVGAAHPRTMALDAGLGVVWRADEDWATALQDAGTFSSSWPVAVGQAVCWAEITPRLVDEVLSHTNDEPAAYLTIGSHSDVEELALVGGDVEAALRIVRTTQETPPALWRLEVEGWAWVWVSDHGADRFGVITDRPDRTEVDDLFDRTASLGIRNAVGIGIRSALTTILEEVGIDGD